MDISFTIARLMGPVLVICAIYLIFCGGRLTRMAEEFLESEALIFLAGITALILGVSIISTHNIWTLDWRGFITIFGWIAFFAGIARIFLGTRLADFGRAMLENRLYIIASGLIMLIGGLVLSYMGYVLVM